MYILYSLGTIITHSHIGNIVIEMLKICANIDEKSDYRRSFLTLNCIVFL